MTPVELPRLSEKSEMLWTALFDIADAQPHNWCVVGGQMVTLHALERGVSPPRVSDDIDLVVDARVRPPGLAGFVTTLERLEFNSTGASPDNVAHRYARGDVTVDVMVPEGLGRRADTRTVGAATTIPVGGGTQALDRTERVVVAHLGRESTVPRPSLLGAIVIKAAAVDHDNRDKSRHVRDLAFLCSLVGEVPGLQHDTTRKDRQRLARVTVLDDPRHDAWSRLTNPEVAFAAFQLLKLAAE